MNAALLTIARESLLSASAAHDYTAGEPFTQHDVVELVDPDGVPCATPQSPVFTNEDYPYSYITGAQGYQTRQIRRDLSIFVDYIGPDVAAKLEQLLHERARVLVSPNFGRSTVFSWRAGAQRGSIYADGGTVYDTTGRHAMALTQNPGVLLWDRATRMFAPASVANSAHLFATPGGGGHGICRSVRNLCVPAYPVSATEGPGAGSAGWARWGADAAHLSFTHKPNAFGHPLCPHALRVNYTGAASTGRAIGWQGLWDSGDGTYGGIPLAGVGTGALTIWLRGKFPDGAFLNFGPNAERKTLSLAGLTFNGWTPVSLAVYSANWTSTTASAYLNSISIGLNATNGEPGWFEVGPIMFVQSAGIKYQYGAYWSGATTFSGTDVLRTTAAFEIPEEPTLLLSFYVPPDWDAAASSRLSEQTVGLLGGNAGEFGLTLNRTSAGVYYAVFADVSSGGSMGATQVVPAPTPGAVNTLAVVLRTRATDFYMNGVLAGTPTANPIRPGGAALSLRVGGDHLGATAWPFIMLTARIDEGNLGADAIRNWHLSQVDPVAGAFARAARGRVYRITGIPATLRDSAGGSQVLGTIRLEQVDYKPNLADPIANREASVP